jgi:hypothetical protein
LVPTHAADLAIFESTLYRSSPSSEEHPPFNGAEYPIIFGLGVSTTVRLVRTEGGAALDSLAGGVYVRPGASCCRPLLCVCYLCAHPLSAPGKSP